MKALSLTGTLLSLVLIKINSFSYLQAKGIKEPYLNVSGSSYDKSGETVKLRIGANWSIWTIRIYQRVRLRLM